MNQGSDMSLHLAFAYSDGILWTGGLHYLRNLFAAMRSLEEPLQPEISLLVPPKLSRDSYGLLEPYLDRLLYMPAGPTRSWKLNHWYARAREWLGIAPPVLSYLRTQSVACLFSTEEYGPHFAMPLLTWIPDFQHHRLPEMFPDDERRERDRRYRRIEQYATRVIVSSRDALNDWARFAPEAMSKARVLSFVAQVPAEVYSADPVWICNHYHLPQRFFYLPNQFWKHKNHQVVLRALDLLHAQHPEIVVVCTGNTRDYRHSQHFAQLQDMIAAKQLATNFIILGAVPHEHVLQLMRQSLAVLQPSLFEGWSTPVEEAKSIGKSIIISDLPVHREQDPPAAAFFDPHDPEQLAHCLKDVFVVKAAGPDVELEAQARAQLPERTRQFGARLIDIAQEAVRSAEGTATCA